MCVCVGGGGGMSCSSGSGRPSVIPINGEVFAAICTAGSGRGCSLGRPTS